MTELYPEWRVGAISLTEAPYAVPFGGVDYGAPENVTQILQSLLQDGDIELSTRTGNRTLVLPVLIQDSDMAALAEAEAALVLECDKVRNEVYVDPGDGFGAPFIFEVFRGQITFDRDDNYEINGFRSYTLTFRALPYPRSVDEVVTPALPPTGTTTTLVNNGGATTGWTSTSGAPAVVSGAVRVATAALSGPQTVDLTYTASITTSSTKYLVVDWKPESGIGRPDLRAYGDGVELGKVAQVGSPTAGYTRTTFYVAASSIAVLRLDSQSSGASGIFGSAAPASVRSLAVDNINRTDVKPAMGTSRQLLRSIEVPGSARTKASVAVEHETSALGDTIVYFFPDDDASKAYSPPLRQYRVSGGTVVPDSARVSGASESIYGATVTYDIPLRNLVSGAHVLVGLFKVSSVAFNDYGVTLSWAASARVNSTAIAGGASGSIALDETGAAYVLLPIARVQFPTNDVDQGSTTAVTRLTLTTPTGGANLTIDEVWAFNTTIGQYTQVACGTGTAASGGPARRLFMEPATAERPRPALRIGHAADGSDSYYPGSAVAAWSPPEVAPPRVNVFTVTTNASDVAVSQRQFPHWHTHAAS